MAQNYPMNNTAANLMNPYQQPPPLVVVPPNQINMAAKNMESNIIHNQEKYYHKQETNRLKDEVDKLRNEKIINEIKNLKEDINDIKRAPTQNTGNPNIIVNVQQQQQQQQQQGPAVVEITNGRLKYDSGSYCLFLCLNIFLPGVGTMVAGCQYGKTSDIGDRTGELICHGVFQLCCCVVLYGWIWAILDATRYFEKGTCGC